VEGSVGDGVWVRKVVGVVCVLDLGGVIDWCLIGFCAGVFVSVGGGLDVWGLVFWC